MLRTLSASALILSLQVLLTACAGVKFYEPIGSIPGQKPASAAVAETVAEPAPVAAENPYLRKRGRASREALRRFEIANGAMELREWSVAMSELQWLLDNYPEYSGPCLNMALVYQQQGEADKAEQYFRKTLQINRDNLDAYNQYAIFLREQGRFEEAEQAYLQALGVWEWHAETHRNIGVLYDMYMGDQGRALLHFQRYQELNGADDRTVAGWIVDLQRRQFLLVKGA